MLSIFCRVSSLCVSLPYPSHLLVRSPTPSRRLQLSFQGRLDPDGQWRFYSTDHLGMFISNRRDPLLGELLKGIPHSVVLENAAGELAVMVPAQLPVRMKLDNELCSSELIFLR